MKTTAILVAVALVAMVTPVSANEEECDNAAYWDNILNTRPEGHNDAIVNDPRVTIGELKAEQVDKEAILDDLVAHTSGFCLAEMLAGEETGTFPQVSDFFLIQEVAYDFTGQHCNQGENVGAGGHFDTAVDATTGAMPWSWGSAEYAGVATSDISVSSTAYFADGFFLDVSTGKGFGYAQEVTYIAVSDFYCVGFFDAFFGDYVTINLPYATGLIA